MRVFDPRPQWWRIFLFMLLIFILGLLLIRQSTKPSDFVTGNNAQVIVGDHFSHPHIAVHWDIRAGYENNKYFVSISPPILRDPTTPKRATLPCDPIVFIQSDDPRAVEARNEFAKWTKPWYDRLEGDEFAWHKEHAKDLENAVVGYYIEEIDCISILAIWLIYILTTPLLIYIVLFSIVRKSIGNRTRRIHAGLCPSCIYNTEGTRSRLCPECGLDVAREAELLRLLNQKGYRGLKQFMKEDGASV